MLRGVGKDSEHEPAVVIDWGPEVHRAVLECFDQPPPRPWTFTLRCYRDLLSAMADGEGLIVGPEGGDKTDAVIWALPGGIKVEWSSSWRMWPINDHCYLASKYGRAPRDLKKGNYYLAERDRQLVIIRVESGVYMGGRRAARWFPVRVVVLALTQPLDRSHLAPELNSGGAS
jgi:hypothetical protein